MALIVVALPVAGVPAGYEPAMRRLLWIVAAAALAAAVAFVALRPRNRSTTPDPLELLCRRGSALARVVAISVLVQTTLVPTNVWLARQVGVEIGLAPWFVAWPLSKLAAVLPISLGGIGVREATLVSFLIPYGAPRNAVLASGILWQAVLAVTALFGLLVTQMAPRFAPAAAPVESPATKA